MDRTGFAAGTLAVRGGLRAPVPSLDPRPVLTMGDMGHGGHGGMDHSADANATPVTPPRPIRTPGTRCPRQPHAAAAPHPSRIPQASEAIRWWTCRPPSPTSRLDDPGIGLRGNGRRVLTYSDLRSTFEDPDGREPSRTIELHLTGHMDRFTWSFDGIKFSPPNHCASSTASGSGSSSSTTR